MNQDLLHQAATIFGTPEKWRAFHDMQQACPAIISHWLTEGAKSLRDEFAKNAGQWECQFWGTPRDTRWFLKDLGEKSISVGIGWETFELHLFDGRNSETWQKAADLLEEPEFRPLVARIGPRCYRSSWQKERLLLADLGFDPLGTGADAGFRARLIAWHAGREGHGTGEFVEKTLEWMRQLLEDDKFIRLIRELDRQSSDQAAKQESPSGDVVHDVTAPLLNPSPTGSD
jgi:hypothetical protein